MAKVGGFMESEIEKLRQDILMWQDILNKEGVWLFLGTLGSWSVEKDYFLRLVALGLTLSFFFVRAHKQRKNTEAFDKRIAKLEGEIKKCPELGKDEKAQLYDLNELKKLFEFRRLFSRSPIYFACTAFWLVSFFRAIPLR
jgi:hypothetical protein